MALARAFFALLAEHVQAALAEWPDGDLAAARRVFSALVTAMSRFEDEFQQS
jgi:hypothetical protein